MHYIFEKSLIVSKIDWSIIGFRIHYVCLVRDIMILRHYSLCDSGFHNALMGTA